MYRLLFIAIFLFSVNVFSSHAETVRFETLSDGMVDALTDEQSKGVNLKIEFDVDSDVIRRDSYPILNELCKALEHRLLRNQNIIIKGHTDSDGSAEYNQKLSQRRATAIKRYLESNCLVFSQRLKITGCGESMPLLPNTTPFNKQKNRRVEIQIDPESIQKTPLMPSESQGLGFQRLE